MFLVPKKLMNEREKDLLKDYKDHPVLGGDHWARVATKNFMIDHIATSLSVFNVNELVEIADKLDAIPNPMHSVEEEWADESFDKFEDWYRRNEFKFKGWKRS